MPTNKDFKRLVRSRMRKTGESYTAARSHFLPQRSSSSNLAPAPTTAPGPAPAKADYARLAGMSDDALKAKTGCTWVRWVEALDVVKAHQWPHRAIAEYVHDKFKVPGWWSQTVTVGYERIKGLREIGQRRDGNYEATKSMTLPVSVSRLYRAWRDKRERSRWLPDGDLVIRTATRNRSMRITWPDGTSVELWFTAKGRSKAQVQVQHTRLPDRAAAAVRKAFWAARLKALADVVAPAG